MDFHRYVRERVPSLAVAREPEIVHELAQHLSDLYQEARASGLGHNAAMARAAAALPEQGESLARDIRLARRGRTGSVADRCVASWDPFHDTSGGSSMFSDLRLDLKFAIRTVVRAPGFTVIAIVVLALGIGANATVFSLANAFFLRPLPVSDPETIVRVYSNRYSNTPHRSYIEYRDRNSTLAGMAAFQMQSFGLRIDAETEHTFGTIVSGGYFSVLGVAPARGRLLVPSDDRADAPPAVVLSYTLWKRRFGEAPDVIGRTIGLNDQAFTIVGVAAEGFPGLMTPLVGDLWVPLAADALLRPALDPATRLDTTSLHLVGRLKPGVDRARVQAELDSIGRQLRRARGEPDQGQAVTVYGSTVLHPEISPPVTAFTAVLMTLVALVLLIVCVNVANLVLARAAGRETELAIRQSLGAGRGRLIRQLLTENLLLSLAGAAAGLAIAFWGTRLLMAVPLPTPFPVALDLSIDLRVLAFTIVAAVGATLAFGVVPALSASRIDLVRAVKGIGGDGPRHGRLRSAFLVAQMSMSVLLLITAGLFIRGSRHARSIDIGFDASQVLTASIDLGTRGYPEARGHQVVRALAERLEAAPDVVSANVVDMVPVTLSNAPGYMLRDGDVEPARDQPLPTPNVYTNAVGPGHFRTLQIAMVAGRDFTHLDGEASPRVAIINETLARRFWPGKSAVGQRLRPLRAGSDVRQIVEVVGVVRDSTYVTVGEEPRPFMYRPFAQAYTPRVTLLVRSAGTPISALSTIKEAVRTQDPGLAIFNVATLAEAISVSLLPARIAASLLGALGMLALALATLGIYGVLSFLVRSRTREIGVRVALGATPRTLTTMVLRQAMTWTVVGAAIGIALAAALTRFLEGFLYGISPTDAWTFGGVTLMLVLVACVAALVPAVRASRLDPLVALRTL
jgi:predicted permease